MGIDSNGVDWGRYLAEQEEERLQLASKMAQRLTLREQCLVREAAVMGFFQGSEAAGGFPVSDERPYPKDSTVTRTVLVACTYHPDLYPVIASLEGT